MLSSNEDFENFMKNEDFMSKVSCTYSSFRFVSVANILSGRDVIEFREKSL